MFSKFDSCKPPNKYSLFNIRRGKEYDLVNANWKQPFALSAILISLIASASAQQKADTILVNCKVYTENSNQPWAEAIAVSGEKIMAVGDNASIGVWKNKETKSIDCQQHMVMPGFTDSHVHFIMGSQSLRRVPLDEAGTVEDVQKRLLAFAAGHPDAKVIEGFGWMYQIFGAAGIPDRKMIDAVLADKPVILESYDGHSRWVNTKALEQAGITNETPNPLNGIIVRDPAGAATGMLKEAAMTLVDKVEPEPSEDELISALTDGIKLANSFGLTRVDSAGGDAEKIEVFDKIRQKGLLTLRFTMAPFLQPPAVTPEMIASLEQLRATHHDDWISATAVKFWADGVIESHTAAMLEPYSDDPTLNGHTTWTPEAYRAGVLEFNKRGFQIYTHAIGDKTIRMALDSYQAAHEANKTESTSRDRIEHIEDPDPTDIPRFGKLGVIASMQPLHAYPNDDVLQVWAKNVGAERAKHAWPWRDILSGNGHLTFGSDWPVVTMDPWKAIQTLLTRETLEGTPKGGWLPYETLNLQQAIYGYTLGAAYAGFRDKKEGSIEAGKLADFIEISQNLFDTPVHEIHNTRVLRTFVGGKQVYQFNGK